MPAAATGFSALLTGVGLLFVLGSWGTWQRTQRETFIRAYAWPPGLMECFGDKHPGRSAADRAQVEQALRQFFLVHLRSDCGYVSMPSRVVDDLWHEFILYTREYRDFAAARSGNACTTCRRQRCRLSASRPISGCAARGRGPVMTKASTPVGPIACRCCSPSTRSSPSRRGSSICRTAPRGSTAARPCTVAPIFPAATSTAASRVSVPSAKGDGCGGGCCGDGCGGGCGGD